MFYFSRILEVLLVKGVTRAPFVLENFLEVMIVNGGIGWNQVHMRFPKVTMFYFGNFLVVLLVKV